VVNILNSHGQEVGPNRGEGSWDEIINTHVQTLWACDFFTQKVLTLNGWVDYYLILFVHLDTRRLFITPATRHPTDEWMIQQAKNFLIHIEEQGLQITHLIRDNDGKFTGGGLDAILESVGAEIVTTSLRAPNMNPYAERTIQSVQTESLDHFIVLGERHLNYLISEYLAYYHSERPHQGKGYIPLAASAAGASNQADSSKSSDTPLRLKDIACRERLGGLLKHYYRKAA
jgi:putative transposase